MHNVPITLHGLIQKILCSSVAFEANITAVAPPPVSSGISLTSTDIKKYVMLVVMVIMAFAVNHTGAMQLSMMEKTTVTKSQ